MVLSIKQSLGAVIDLHHHPEAHHRLACQWLLKWWCVPVSFVVIHGDASSQIWENTFISYLMGITGRHAFVYHFNIFVVKCVIYFWRPWQFPDTSPYSAIVFLIICTAPIIWAAIIVCTLAVRYFCAIISLFRGVFATIWTLIHFWCVLPGAQRPSFVK